LQMWSTHERKRIMPALPARPKKRRNETSDLTRPIVAALNAIPGVWASRNNVGHATTENGWPVTYGLGTGSADVVGVVAPYGRAFFLEVKWPGKGPSDEQRAFLSRLERLGASSHVVHSIDEATAIVRGMLPT
jgi:hypothetical protein